MFVKFSLVHISELCLAVFVIIFTDILEYSLKQKKFIQFSWARRKSIKTLVAGENF